MDALRRSIPTLLQIVGVAGLTLLGNLIGFGREVVTAQHFGASSQMDHYLTAYVLPGFFINLGLTGFIGATVIPSLAAASARTGGAGVDNAATMWLRRIALWVFVITAGGILTGHAVVRWLAPGYDQHELALTARLMIPLFVLAGLTWLMSYTAAILNFNGHFRVPALSSAVFNGCAVVGMIVAGNKGISVLPWSLVVGVTVVVIIQSFIALKARATSSRPDRLFIGDVDDKTHTAVVVGIVCGVDQIVPVVERALGSFFQAGSISALYFANKLSQLPATLVGLSVATVLFPHWAKSAVTVKRKEFRGEVTSGIALTTGVIIPFAVVTWFGATLLVNFAFARGAFSADSALQTQSLVRWYAVGIVPQGALFLLARAFYALGEVRTLLFVRVIGVLLTIVVDVQLAGALGARGLVIGSVVGAWVTAATLWWRLTRQTEIHTFSEPYSPIPSEIA